VIVAQFLLLARRARGEDLAPAELQRRTRAMVSWIARGVGSGEIVAGGRIDRGGVRLIERAAQPLDEDHGSYYVIEAVDLAAAIACASSLDEDAIVLPLDAQATLQRR
jgi:hypothetical protein